MVTLTVFWIITIAAFIFGNAVGIAFMCVISMCREQSIIEIKKDEKNDRN